MTLPEFWRKIVAKALRRFDQVVHAPKRKQARLRRIGRGRPPRVMVVCYGNICRSPYAEAYLRHRIGEGAGPNIEIDSSGLIGPNRPADEVGAAIARERGLDLSGHRSKLFRNTDATRFDLFLVMTRSQRDQLIGQFGVPRGRIELLGDFDSADPPYREIDDPYGRPEEEFRKVFGQIERSVDGLCDIWAAHGGEHGGNPAATS